MKVGALSRRALAEGVVADALDAAEDAADPKAVIIGLILVGDGLTEAEEVLRSCQCSHSTGGAYMYVNVNHVSMSMSNVQNHNMPVNSGRP